MYPSKQNCVQFLGSMIDLMLVLGACFDIYLRVLDLKQLELLFHLSSHQRLRFTLLKKKLLSPLWTFYGHVTELQNKKIDIVFTEYSNCTYSMCTI